MDDMFEDSSYMPGDLRSRGRNLVGKRLFASTCRDDSDTCFIEYEAATIFLRIDESESSKNLEQNGIILESNNTVALKSLEDDTTEKYSFNYVYAEDIGHDVFIEHFVSERLYSLLHEERHVTLLMFGSTTHYKELCIYGDNATPGLIIKSIQIILNSIKGKEMQVVELKPMKFNTVVHLDDDLKAELSEFKQDLLNNTQTDDKVYENNFEELCDICEAADDVGYLVWISFIEVTDEGIFDVLCKDGESLKIVRDDENNKYVKGTEYVFVKNDEEAYKIMMIAKQNKTKQSHLIFTIKLVKHNNPTAPEYATVFSFSVIDVDGDSGLTNGILTTRGKIEEDVRKADLKLCELLEREFNDGPRTETHMVITASSSNCEETKRIIMSTNESFKLLPKIGKIRYSDKSSFTMVSVRQSDYITSIEEDNTMWDSDQDNSVYVSDLESDYDEDEEKEECENVIKEIVELYKARETIETKIKKEFTERMEMLLQENADYWRKKTENEVAEREKNCVKQISEEREIFEAQLAKLDKTREPERFPKLKKVFEEYNKASRDKNKRLKEAIEEIKLKEEEQKLSFKVDEERLLKIRDETVKSVNEVEKKAAEIMEGIKRKEKEEDEKNQAKLIELKTEVFDLRNELKKDKELCNDLDVEIEKLTMENKENTPKKKKGKPRYPKTEPKKRGDVSSLLESPDTKNETPVPSTVQKPLRKKLFRRLDNI